MYLSSECVCGCGGGGVKRQASGVKQASNKDRDRTGMEWTWSGHGADMEGTVDMEWTGSGVSGQQAVGAVDARLLVAAKRPPSHVH
jgi:hypothetical protein